MKLKHLVILLFLSVATLSFAQNSSKDSISNNSVKPILRVEAGYVGNVRYSDLISKSPLYTERVGVSLEFPLQYNFGISAGLNYNFGKGSKSQYYMAPKDTLSYKYSNHSLGIPVHLNYTLPIFWGMKIFGYVGPNFTIGLTEPTTTNDAKFDRNLLSWNESEKYDNYSRKTKRFDIQLGAGGGIQWKNFRVKSGYDWGLLNVSKIGGSQHTKGWNVSFEYEF